MGPTLLGMDHVRACLGQYDEALEGMLKTLRWLESLKQTRYQLIAYDLIGHLLIEACPDPAHLVLGACLKFCLGDHAGAIQIVEKKPREQ